ncbi:phage tail protein [Marinigracilibium pacificum]|uniref:Phage tail protein n=1 Tax=Marinigracilibium pacificum TaxID=2729599 RepID=A0A848IXW6_9BACT|nr:phage tail protein [Marinigracilibium pacificum]NMM48476.1 phage tail protein [Marinigracilibium pacificum]
MAEELWPVPKFHFQVEWGDVEVGFQEVTGLEMETQFIEYRSGNDPELVTRKIPGLKKHGTITLKKGVFRDDLTFYEWFEDVQTNKERREDVIITLLDEEDEPVMVWTVSNAFPTKISGPDLKSDANEIAVESLELAHEGIVQSLS